MKNVSREIIEVYNMAQITSGKIARCDWLLTWWDFSVMTAGIMKIVNAMWRKTLKIVKKKIKKLKTKQNTEMSNK